MDDAVRSFHRLRVGYGVGGAAAFPGLGAALSFLSCTADAGAAGPLAGIVAFGVAVLAMLPAGTRGVDGVTGGTAASPTTASPWVALISGGWWDGALSIPTQPAGRRKTKSPATRSVHINALFFPAVTVISSPVSVRLRLITMLAVSRGNA